MVPKSAENIYVINNSTFNRNFTNCYYNILYFYVHTYVLFVCIFDILWLVMLWLQNLIRLKQYNINTYMVIFKCLNNDKIRAMNYDSNNNNNKLFYSRRVKCSMLCFIRNTFFFIAYYFKALLSFKKFSFDTRRSVLHFLVFNLS